MNRKYLLILYFICSFLFANQYSELDISNFYESTLDSPCITFDPAYTTAYYLNSYNPNILSDYQILDIRINASSLNPIGTYIISPLYKFFIKDTLSSTAFEHNRGDYGYNENVIFINNKYKNNLSSFFMAQSKKYDGLQSINSNSDALQNYFLNISKNYFQSNQSLYGSISSSLMYHKENTIIPLINGSYGRNSEGFLSGFSINSNYSNFIKLKISNSFQLNREKFDLGLYSDKYSAWFDVGIKFRLNNYINFISSYNRKENSHDSKLNQSDFLYEKVILNKWFLTGQLKYDKFIFNLTLIMFNQKNDSIPEAFEFLSPRLNFNFIYSLNEAFKISIDRVTHSFLNEFTTNNLFDLSSLKISYNNAFLQLRFEPFQLTSYLYNPELVNPGLYKEGKISGINTFLSFKTSYIISEIKSSFYQSDYTSPINFCSNYSILFAPKINRKRFRPFIGLNGVFMNLNESSYIDMSNDDFFPFINNSFDNSNSSSSKNINLLNIQLGIVLNRFKISYYFTNPINSNVLFSFSDSYQSIAPFSKLQITWQFLD